MLKKLSEQKFFEEFVRLNGKRIRLSLKSTVSGSEENEIVGTVINSMFDSCLLETKKGNLVVRYDDLLFFEESV
jgi:hypothetical protein